MSTFLISNNTNYDVTLPLPIRQNNPMALRDTDSTWEGEIVAIYDSGFEWFESVEYGLRAGMYNIIRNYFGEGYNTITSIFNKYAPPSENDTASYINYVSESMNISAESVLLPTSDNILKLARAIVDMENGASYGYMVTDSQIAAGYDLLPATITSETGIVWDKSSNTGVLTAGVTNMITGISVLLGLGLLMILINEK
jgi:hypothetical protein